MILVPIALGGKIFADYGVGAGFAFGQQQGPSVSSLAIPRADASPIYVGTSQGVRTLTIDFIVEHGTTSAADVGYVLRNILALVHPGDANERVLVARFADGPDADTEVEMLVSTGQYRYGSRNNVFVDFYAADEKWSERIETVLPQVVSTGSVAVPLNNKGGATVSPVIKVGYDTQRTTEDSSVGWKYRRTVTITNNGTTNWKRVRKTIDLGDTAAWVTGSKAQADGDDLRVWFEGRNLNRSLTNWNTKRTLLHIHVTIPAGESAEYEIVYGNPDATTATTLSTRTGTRDTYVADDLTGTSGTATAGAGSTLTDSGAAWENNRWRYGYIQITGGTGSGQRRRHRSWFIQCTNQLQKQHTCAQHRNA